jgi:hypothetical protein
MLFHIFATYTYFVSKMKEKKNDTIPYIKEKLFFVTN